VNASVNSATPEGTSGTPVTSGPADPYAAADRAAARLRELSGAESHDILLVMGSGWAPAVDALGAPEAEFPMADLPDFPPPVVEGQGGTVRSYRFDGSGKRALVFLGRTHHYEGHGVATVAHGVRTAVAAGCKTVVLTNGCGGLREGMRPGQPVLISDHINLTGVSPIVGPHFVDLTDLYSPRLRALCKEIDPALEEGVYAMFPGPHYETPAEINMVRVLGGDLVGMSTVLEAIAAREAGAEVLGISLVTNLAAGLSGQPLNHEEVIQAGRDSAKQMGALLARVLERV
jgi:purine-nucleoside phosphorylase